MAGTSIADQLAKLKEQAEKLERARRDKAAKIDTAARGLDADRKELEELDGQQRDLDANVDATGRLETDLAGAAKVRAEARDLGAAAVTKVRQEQTALAARIEQDLSQARRDALGAEIDKIDDAITRAGAAADDAGGKLAAGEQAMADARETADDAAAAHADVLRHLVAFPQRTEVARAKVDSLRTAANTAVDAGRIAEAFVRTRDLKAALAELEAAVKDTSGDKLADQLPKLWSDNLAAAAALASASAAVEPLREKANAARLKRDELVAGREKSIAAALGKP